MSVSGKAVIQNYFYFNWYKANLYIPHHYDMNDTLSLSLRALRILGGTSLLKIIEAGGGHTRLVWWPLPLPVLAN